MSDLQDRIARLSPEKRALLERLLRKQGVDAAHATIPPRRRTSAEQPLSYGQQRLWFLNQMEPGNSFYNIVDAIALDEPIDPALVERVLDEIVRRHETLRTTFATRNGEPVQIIAASARLPLHVVDLRALPAAEKDAAVARISADNARRPFDLSRGPLIRATLLRTNADTCDLLLAMHHIVSDAWSLDVLERELRALYAAFSEGKPSPLAPIPLQYADFAQWQRESLAGEVLTSQLAYWTKHLAGAPASLDLPTARPRPAVPTYRGATQSRGLSSDLSRALKSLAQREGVTLFMTTLAAFDVLLWRYTHQPDVVVGTPVAGRNRAETEPLIGFFVNTLVLRTDLAGNPAFRTLLQRTREVCLGAFAHQDLPFEMLVEALRPQRDLSRNPLFQVSFQLSHLANRGEDESLDLPAPDSPPDVERGTAKFDLGINVWDNGEYLKVQADYSTDLFDDQAMTRLLAHFESVLRHVAVRPDEAIGRVPLLSAAERSCAVEDWNRTATAYPRDAALGELFTQQVERSPSAIAVTCADEQVTYAELNARTDRLARHLVSLGVGPDTPVGLFMERSIELVVGMLGIVKAGGAYVPIDPEYPLQRIALMIDDADIDVMVTQERLAGVLSAVDLTVVCVDSAETAIAEAGGDVPSGVAGANLAYVIYTSGSTGLPKGVAITHGAVARTVCNTNYIALGGHDRVAQASNAAFDAATFEIWGALLGGATLVIVPTDVLLVPERLVAEVRQRGITVFFLTTAVFNQVAAAVPDAFSGLRCLLFGGEAADPRSVGSVLETGRPLRLLHVYGPTESTTFASWHEVETVPADASTIPIGRPLANSQIYLLDEHLEPVPVGVFGELYIGGDGLARGYLNHPDRTAERFIPDPFARESGARLYRSGDIARYLPGGAIEFVGRRDEQVKIRGHRIELGEVESLLREHRDVRDVVAVCREDVRGEKRLVAYVVARNEARLSAADLRAHLMQRAPDYLVPSAFVPLAELPLTPNGKVDRRALPLPEQVRLTDAADRIRPETPAEELIAGIYAAVLRMDRVGRHASFFELGGHSLLATQILSRIREAFHVDVPLRVLFMNHTVAALAAAVEAAQHAGVDASGPAIAPLPRDRYRASVSPAGVLEIPVALKTLLRL